MGKSLIIPGADFSANALEHIKEIGPFNGWAEIRAAGYAVYNNRISASGEIVPNTPENNYCDFDCSGLTYIDSIGISSTTNGSCWLDNEKQFMSTTVPAFHNHVNEIVRVTVPAGAAYFRYCQFSESYLEEHPNLKDAYIYGCSL